MGKLGEIFQKIANWFLKLNAGQKQKLAITCTIIFSVLLTISALISMGKTREVLPPAAPEGLTIITPVAAEDIFLPDEPDFLPAVLLEREQRTSWTEQDASEYWQDPLRFGEEQWRIMIEAVIDDLLERVP